MKFATVLSVLASAAAVLAAYPGTDIPCPVFNATEIIDGYISILEHSPSVEAANATAQALLSETYEEISDSILTLEGLPLGTVTFQGKDTYIESTLGAPASSGIETILIIPACGYITWHWVFYGIGSMEYEIKGFNLFEITAAGQINTTRLEFNSIAWGADTGYVTLFPGQNCTTDPTDAQAPLKKRNPAALSWRA